MRIAHIIPSFNIGGVQKLVLQIVTTSGFDKGQQIVTAFGGNSFELFDDFKKVCYSVFLFPLSRKLPNFRPYRLYSFSNNLFRRSFTKIQCLRLMKMYSTHDVDIIHIHIFDYYTVYNLLKFSEKNKMKCVWSIHGNTKYSEKHWLKLTKFMKNNEKIKITQVTNYNNRILQKIAKKEKISIETIPNGIDLSLYENQQINRHKLRNIIGELDQDKNIIIHVGRLKKIKGQDILIKAISQLDNKESVRLILIGEGISRETLEDLVSNLSLEKIVFFLGQRKDIPQLLAGADLFVLPSRSEGVPLALLEAMASGLPVITTDVGSCGSLVKDSLSGIVVSPEDPNQLAEAIDKLIMDKVLMREFSLNALEKSNEFNTNRTINRYFKLYRQMI